MSGFFVELFARLRAAMEEEATISIDTLPPAIVEPIQAALDRYCNARRLERHIRWGWIDLHFRIPARRRISRRQLRAIFAQHINIAAESERVFWQQRAAIEARGARDLAAARAELLATMSVEDRSLLEARLQARAEAETNAVALRNENEALKSEVAAVTAKNLALTDQNRRLRARRKSARRPKGGSSPRRKDAGRAKAELV